MKNSTWKSVERKIAALFGGTRNPISGRVRSNSIADVDHDLFSIEVKHKKDGIPSWLTDALEQAIMAKKTEGHIPIVVLHKKGTKYEDCPVLIQLSDLITLYEQIKEK